MSSPLITPAELTAESADPATRPLVLDVRWSLAGPDRAAHLAGHVPGALFVDLDAELAGPPGAGGRHPLPDPGDLQNLWRELGLDDGTPVVVYDARDASVAGRAWWLLRWSGHRDVRVLDGGWAAWQRAGGPVEPGEVPRPGGGTFTAAPGGLPVVGIEDVAAVADGRSAATQVDLRAAARFRGEVEPVDPVAGHIPGASNLPCSDLVEPDGTFPEPDVLRARLAVAGVVAGSTAIATCGSGVTACQLVLAADSVGISTALYPGSYSGWCAAGRRVATGPGRVSPAANG
jgi:thiosulfate/3-mercaptopyruvate sulfurtransferase